MELFIKIVNGIVGKHKKGKKLRKDFLCYRKIPNTEHRTHQVGLFRLMKISSQK